MTRIFSRPNTAHIWLLLSIAYAINSGEALANLNKWEDALAAYSAVPEGVGPELYGDALYSQCFALHKLGRYEPALDESGHPVKVEINVVIVFRLE